MNTIYFITGNSGKVKEVQEKFKDFNIKIVQKNLGYPEIQADTIKEVAKYGLEFLKNKINKPFILEDAGIFIKGLKDFPGVYSKYVFYTIGNEGILKLLEEKENRNAIFRSVYAYYSEDGETKYFLGECKGLISTKSKGNNGFGYDPIFIPNNQNKTFAEMDLNEKNKYSHRGKAIDELIKSIIKD